ncbi:TetR family transcriptional regulator [Halospina denitrificans]|uniref:TetR family transcriptional regulator n=1 Tax=Halospina denitrificans TaxID=332522 RepID=A0A4R7K152_9GAMM|nr:TetR/AcrR family transcriptional regulator [Halospina denitrificans]TDT44156.1 TetR family transcriptional regulator [Halospina denitrificans]
MPRSTRHDPETTVRRAAHLFWERGYHACSLKQLETALDMRPGSIYAAFGSKESLFRAALMAYYEQLHQGMTQVLASHERVLDGLAAYLRQLAVEATMQPDNEEAAPVPACMMVKTLLEATVDTPGLEDTVNDLFDRIERDLTTTLETARDQGELAADVDCARLARLWQAQIMGLRTFAQRRVDAEVVTLLAEDMIQAMPVT